MDTRRPPEDNSRKYVAYTIFSVHFANPQSQKLGLGGNFCLEVVSIPTTTHAHTHAHAHKDPVINRVAGFMCMHILNGHTGCGSGLELVKHKSKHYLVSG